MIAKKITIIVAFFISQSICAQSWNFHPLPLSVCEEYREKATMKTDIELKEMLKKQKRFRLKQILIEEIKNNRCTIDINDLICELIDYTENESYRLERFRTEIISFYRVEQAKLKKGDTILFLKNLHELLIEAKQMGNGFLANNVINELYKIGDANSLSILKKFEDNWVAAKMSKLRIEMKGMNEKEHVTHLLESVKEKLIRSDLTNYPNFAAERSLINYRRSSDTLEILRVEMILPNTCIRIDSRKHRIYIQLLRMLEYKIMNPNKSTNPLFNPDPELYYLTRKIL